MSLKRKILYPREQKESIMSSMKNSLSAIGDFHFDYGLRLIPLTTAPPDIVSKAHRAIPGGIHTFSAARRLGRC